MTEYVYGITCVGSRELLAALERSLCILYRHHGSGFFTSTLIKQIVESEVSVVRPHYATPTFSLGPVTAFHSDTWLASCLVHEGQHVALFQHARQSSKKVLPSAWNGREAELHCLSVQLEASRRVRAPLRERRHIESQNGLHFLRKQYW